MRLKGLINPSGVYFGRCLRLLGSLGYGVLEHFEMQAFESSPWNRRGDRVQNHHRVMERDQFILQDPSMLRLRRTLASLLHLKGKGWAC